MSSPRVLVLSSALDSSPRCIHLGRPMTVAEVVEAADVQLGLPTIAVMTDAAGRSAPVLRGEWHVRQVTPGQQLAFVPVPGRGSLSSILAAVASIALSIVAPWAAGAIVGAMGLTGTAATIASGVIGAGIMIAGQFIINRLLPKPSNTSLTADAVYTARASSNRAMPNEPIPELFGRLRYPPPYAARPYAEFVDNDQYLYQLHCLSVGHVDVERWEIGDTLVWTKAGGFQGSFATGDTEIEIVRPGDEVTLFPANVVTATTVDGQQAPDGPDWLGPFAANAPGTTISRIMCDYVFPLGLVHIDKKGKANRTNREVRAQYRPIDNAGNPTGDWTPLFSVDHRAATRTPQRFSRGADVAPGRYEVRFGALGEDRSDNTGNTSTLNRVLWAGLRGYVEGFVTPPDCTLVATRIRATEHLSREASGQYLFTCQRLLPTWDDEDGWSEPVATRSPAWAVAAMLRSLGLADDEYDLGWLAAYAELWEGRGDRFDALFDRRWQASEALDAILRAGRAYHVRLGSIIGFVRDEPRQVRRMAFTPDSVVRGSIRRHDVWFSEDAPDHLEIVYLDGETWQEQTLVAAIGAVGQDKPQQLALFGITHHDHAWREGIFAAGENAYRRSFRTFQCEREGRMLVRGDAVVLADPLHELVGFGRLEERDGDVLTLDRPFVAAPGETYHVALRDKRGREWGPCRVASIVGNVVTLDAGDRLAVEAQHGALDLILPDTAVQEPAHVTLLAGEDRLFDGLLVDARPIGSQHWEVTLVNDDQRVHALDETEVMPAPWTPPAMIAPVPDAPQVRGIYADVKRGTLGLELHASWQPASGADRYVAEVSYDEDAADEPETSSWTPAHDGAATRLIAAVAPQPLTLRVAAIGRLQGPWVYYVIDVVPDPLLPPDVVGAEALKEELRLTTRRMQEMYEKAIARMMEIVAGADEVAGAVAEEKSVAVRWRDAAAVAMSALAAAVEVRARIYPQDEKPTGTDYREGDIWIDTDDDNTMHFWSEADEDWLISSALGVATYAQDTPPEGAREGDFWTKTLDGENTLHRFDGNGWVEISDKRIVATASALSAVQAALGDISANGLRKVEVQAGSGDVVARLVDMVRATIGDVWVEAGTIVEVGFEGGDPLKPFANYLIAAARFMIYDPNTGVKSNPLVFENGELKIDVQRFNILLGEDDKLIISGGGDGSYIEMLS